MKILDFKFGCDHVIRVLVENTLRNLRTNSGKQVQRKCTKIEMNGMTKIGEKNTVSIRASGCHESPAFSTFYTLISFSLFILLDVPYNLLDTVD